MTVYTITLNPALDYVMKTEKIRVDDINRTFGEKIYYGGKGINVSVILTRLGIKNTALGFLGGFTGKKLEEMLKKDGICCDFNYLQSGDTRINVKIKSDSEIDFNALGPIVTKKETDDFLDKIDSIIKPNDFLVLSGSVPPSVSCDIYERIFKKIATRNVNFVVDTTGDLLKKVLKYKPFLIKPNHHELGDLFGVKTENDSEIIKYAKELQNMGAKNVLVSRAENGALLLDEYGKVQKTTNTKGKLLNSVGCGDSMVGGFIAGYIKNGDYSYALKLGSACGNATAFSEQLATKDKILNIFSSHFKCEL